MALHPATPLNSCVSSHGGFEESVAFEFKFVSFATETIVVSRPELAVISFFVVPNCLLFIFT